MYTDLTRGNISKSLIVFALPLMAGNILQQFYNIADTLIVGHVLGSNALAAVGSAYTLMTFLTSIFLGLSMGAGALFSICYGAAAIENPASPDGNCAGAQFRDLSTSYRERENKARLKSAIYHAFILIMGITAVLNAAVFVWLDPILRFLNTPAEVWDGMREYLSIIFLGLLASSLYNFFSCLLRALGNSTVPLVFLAVSAALNIFLDILFVAVFSMGIGGAALATILAQYVSGIGILIYTCRKRADLLPSRETLAFRPAILREILSLSILTCLQQSVMNFGILMVQGLVNSFGAVVMAGFAAAVKIDTFAYLPVQDFGNAFSTFVAQNYGANKQERIRQGMRTAFLISICFSLLISTIVCLCAYPLMRLFISAEETGVILCGVRYLRTVGLFYFGIGCLFLFYGYFRGIRRAELSLVLTVISLGLRVLLAYILSARAGESGIWMAIPIGWITADLTGLICMHILNRKKRRL